MPHFTGLLERIIHVLRNLFRIYTLRAKLVLVVALSLILVGQHNNHFQIGSYRTGTQNAKIIALDQAKIQAAKIENQLDSGMSVTRTLAQTLAAIRSPDSDHRLTRRSGHQHGHSNSGKQ